MGIPARLKRIAEHHGDPEPGQDLQLRGRVQPRIRDGMMRRAAAGAVLALALAGGVRRARRRPVPRPASRALRPAARPAGRRDAGPGSVRPGGSRRRLPRLAPGPSRRLLPPDGYRQPDARRPPGAWSTWSASRSSPWPSAAPTPARSPPAAATARSSRKRRSTAGGFTAHVHHQLGRPAPDPDRRSRRPLSRPLAMIFATLDLRRPHARRGRRWSTPPSWRSRTGPCGAGGSRRSAPGPASCGGPATPCCCRSSAGSSAPAAVRRTRRSGCWASSIAGGLLLLSLVHWLAGFAVTLSRPGRSRAAGLGALSGQRAVQRC